MSKNSKFTSLADLAALTGRPAPEPAQEPTASSNLVYSTASGRISHDDKPQRVIADGKTVRVQREKNGRGGKMVTVVRGLPLNDDQLSQLLRELKGRLGGGGTVKEGNLELQGDHRDKLVALLNERGYPAKAAGG